MKNLINKFKLVSEDPIACAELCKQIVSDFHRYLIITDNHGRSNVDDLFNEFIEQYGK